jgi:hypothetical protein
MSERCSSPELTSPLSSRAGPATLNFDYRNQERGMANLRRRVPFDGVLHRRLDFVDLLQRPQRFVEQERRVVDHHVDEADKVRWTAPARKRVKNLL